MLRLRKFQNEDANTISTWLKDEVTFSKWCARLLPNFPVQPQDLINRYEESHNNLQDDFVPLVACDGDKLVGSLFLRMLDHNTGTVRIGFVVVDDAMQGRGYGREMLRLTLEYAKKRWPVKRATLGVYSNNPGAHKCYQMAGFVDQDREPIICEIMGEQWECVEMEYFFD